MTMLLSMNSSQKSRVNRSRPRIGVFGNFGIGNFGNEASLESMLLLLKRARPDAELTCICPRPEQVQEDHQIPALPLNWSGTPLLRKIVNWIYAIKTVRKFELLVIPGTGILSDYCAPPLGMPYSLFRWCLAARLCGVSIGFVSVGAGPIHNPLSRWFIKSAVLMAQYRSYRDNFSKKYVNSLGVNTNNDVVYPDIAFRLPSPPPPAVEFPEADRLTVGVGVHGYHGWYGHIRTDAKIYEEYLGKLIEVVIWLLNHEYRVRLLVGDVGDQQPAEDLRKAVVAELGTLPAKQLIAEPQHSYHDVIRQLAKTDIVIASRFHHLIFALKLGKPSISIGYTDKHNELMARMGMGGFCQHIEHIKVAELTTQLTELKSNKSCYEDVILDAVTSGRQRLTRQDIVFVSQFLEEASVQAAEPLGNSLSRI